MQSGAKGIRQWPINWCTSPIKIHKITPSTVVVETFRQSTNQNSIKVPEIDEATNKKTIYKTLGTSVINSSKFPASLYCICMHACLYESCGLQSRYFFLSPQYPILMYIFDSSTQNWRHVLEKINQGERRLDCLLH